MLIYIFDLDLINLLFLFVLCFRLKDFECWICFVWGFLNIILENVWGDKDFIFLKICVWEFFFWVVRRFLDRYWGFVLFLGGLSLVSVMLEWYGINFCEVFFNVVVIVVVVVVLVVVVVIGFVFVIVDVDVVVIVVVFVVFVLWKIKWSFSNEYEKYFKIINNI